MAYQGQNPKFTTQLYRPQSADPSNPAEGMVFRSDGTSRSKGLWEYREGNWQRFGSDAKTYIANYNIDSSTTSWATYADVAGVVPVNGTGGVATTTFTFSSSSPLRGSGSGIITKDAANRQGEGISTDFTIDTADQGKVLQLSFDFTTSANFVEADYRVFLYDVTNSLLIEGNARDLQANAGYGLYIGNFQTSSNSTSYRLILHCATTNASAYTIKVDNFILSPSQVSQGAIVTDWQSYTPTFTGFGTTSGAVAQWRRVGSSVEVEASFTCGTPTGVEARVSLPSGLTIASTVTALTLVGFGDRNSTAIGWNILASAGNTYFNMDQPNNTGIIARNADLISGAGEVIKFVASTQIAGWSSSITVPSQQSNQVIAFKGYNAGGQSISTTAATTVQYNTVESDSAGGFNTGTYTYTIPEAGYYFLSASYLLGSYITEEKNTIRILRNGASVIIGEGSTTGTAWVNSANGIRFCSKGDTITVTSASQTDASYTIDASQAATALSIFKIGGNQTIGMDEVVGCSYTTNAGQSISNNSLTTVLFEDKVFDTHNAYNTSTGEYTIPVAGKYLVTEKILFAQSNTWAITEKVYALIYVNGVQKAYSINDMPVTSASSIYIERQTNFVFDAIKGDVVTGRTQQVSGGSIALEADGAANQFSVLRIK